MRSPWKTPRPRAVPGRSALVLLAALTGCGSDAFTPPPPPELNALPARSASTAPPSLELILNGRNAADHRIWEAAVRREAGLAKVPYALVQPRPDDPPATQAELIRQASARGVTALIVEPIDDPEVTRALFDARGRGTPVVLLGRALPPQDGAPALVSVTFPPMARTAHDLIVPLLAEARATGLPDDGHALIAYDRDTSADSGRFADLMADALRSAGVPQVAIVPFTGGYERGTPELIARIKADPRVTLLLAPEEQGLAACLEARDRLKTERSFSLAGGTPVVGSVDPSVRTACAALFDRSTTALVRTAVRLALRLARGESVAPENVIPRPIYEVVHRRATDRANPSETRPPD